MTDEMIKVIYEESKKIYRRRKFLPLMELEDFQQEAWIHINEVLDNRPETQDVIDYIKHKLNYFAKQFYYSQMVQIGQETVDQMPDSKYKRYPKPFQVYASKSLYSGPSEFNDSIELSIPEPEKDETLYSPKVPKAVREKLTKTEMNLLKLILLGYTGSDIGRSNRLYGAIVDSPRSPLDLEVITQQTISSRSTLVTRKYRKILDKIMPDHKDKEVLELLDLLKNRVHSRSLGAVRIIGRTRKKHDS